MGFFDLLRFSFSSLFYGVIATASIMAILFFILKTLSEGIVRSIPFYITGVILFILLTSNLTLLIGARQVQSTTESMELYLRQMTEGYQGIVSTNESQQVFDSLVEEFPLLGDYLQLADFGGNDISELPTLMSECIREEMSSFIWNRVWWIIGSIVVACVIAVCFENRSVKQPREYTRRHIASETHHRRRYNY
ncbi:MAG: hypothetical protein ACI3ZY_14720 [Parabacteroides sp.]